jgi:hypothetical protein
VLDLRGRRRCCVRLSDHRSLHPDTQQVFSVRRRGTDRLALFSRWLEMQLWRSMPLRARLPLPAHPSAVPCPKRSISG